MAVMTSCCSPGGFRYDLELEFISTMQSSNITYLLNVMSKFQAFHLVRVKVLKKSELRTYSNF